MARTDQEPIALGSCPTCTGPAQFVGTGDNVDQVRHVDLAPVPLRRLQCRLTELRDRATGIARVAYAEALSLVEDELHGAEPAAPEGVRAAAWLEDIVRCGEAALATWQEAHRNEETGALSFRGEDGPFYEAIRSVVDRMRDYHFEQTKPHRADARWAERFTRWVDGKTPTEQQR